MQCGLATDGGMSRCREHNGVCKMSRGLRVVCCGLRVVSCGLRVVSRESWMWRERRNDDEGQKDHAALNINTERVKMQSRFSF